MTWQPVKNKDGTDNRYAQTNGTHNVCAIRRDDKWSFELWLVTTRPHRLIGIYATANAAREAAR